MKEISLIKHAKGALGLRIFGLGPNLKPTNGLIKLQKLLDTNAFWSKNRTINDLKKCLANSDVVISLWVGKEIVGFGRALTDGIYRGVLWGYCYRSKSPRQRFWHINCKKSFICLLYTSPSPRDRSLSRMPSSA